MRKKIVILLAVLGMTTVIPTKVEAAVDTSISYSCLLRPGFKSKFIRITDHNQGNKITWTSTRCNW